MLKLATFSITSHNRVLDFAFDSCFDFGSRMSLIINDLTRFVMMLGCTARFSRILIEIGGLTTF